MSVVDFDRVTLGVSTAATDVVVFGANLFKGTVKAPVAGVRISLYVDGAFTNTGLTDAQGFLPLTEVKSQYNPGTHTARVILDAFPTIASPEKTFTIAGSVLYDRLVMWILDGIRTKPESGQFVFHSQLRLGTTPVKLASVAINLNLDGVFFNQALTNADGFVDFPVNASVLGVGSHTVVSRVKSDLSIESGPIIVTVTDAEPPPPPPTAEWDALSLAITPASGGFTTDFMLSGQTMNLGAPVSVSGVELDLRIGTDALDVPIITDAAGMFTWTLNGGALSEGINDIFVYEAGAATPRFSPVVEVTIETGPGPGPGPGPAPSYGLSSILKGVIYGIGALSIMKSTIPAGSFALKSYKIRRQMSQYRKPPVQRFNTKALARYLRRAR